MCDWCKDKWGLSWQITPIALTDAISDPDPAAAQRAFDAMLQMKKIDYIEFGTSDIELTKDFYSRTFGWTFEDFGSDYTSFEDGRLSGGFALDSPSGNSPLVVIYTSDLKGTLDLVTTNGGKITREIFDFPGGRRFHFVDPGGQAVDAYVHDLALITAE